jgi:menaquinone-dependent protoporphyrinogen oxidase
MKVLVTAASKHGATTEIADSIGDELMSRGLTVAVLPVEKVESVAEYDAVVLGSGVYMGHWMHSAQTFVERFYDDLVMMPLWLFSSGPVGDPLRPANQPVDLGDVVIAPIARDHHIFAGRLEWKDLGLSEKAICSALRVPEGDYRDWADVRDWAGTISEELIVASVVGR